MKIFDSLSVFLHDQKYFIAVLDQKMFVYQYKEIYKLMDTEITLSFNEFKLNIKGENLFISKMQDNELLIEGNINEIKRLYE